MFPTHPPQPDLCHIHLPAPWMWIMPLGVCRCSHLSLLVPSLSSKGDQVFLLLVRPGTSPMAVLGAELTL